MRKALLALLLRWLPQVRKLNAENQTLRESANSLMQENLRLNDRLDALTEDRNRLWDVMQESLRGERQAYQMHINSAWQKQGGGTPYPEAPHLPASAVPKDQGDEPVGRRGRILPSEAIAQATKSFMTQIVGKRA